LEKEKKSRRQFIPNSALIGAAGAVGGVAGTGTLLTSCANQSNTGSKFKLLPSDIPVYIPEMGDKEIKWDDFMGSNFIINASGITSGKYS